jgi:hypothetical protein
VITAASLALAELDWRIVRWLGDPEAVEFGADRGLSPDEFELRGAFEPWRLEAALHAVAAGGKEERLHSGITFPAQFTLAVASRWSEVEEAIDHLRELGLAVTREAVEDAYFDVRRWAGRRG